MAARFIKGPRLGGPVAAMFLPLPGPVHWSDAAHMMELRHMVANGTGEDPHSPKDARLESLDRRLDRIRAEDDRQAEGRVTAESQRVIKSAGMRILSDLIGLPFGAGLIGWLIDRWLGTTPWVMLAMLFLGFGLAVRSVLRVANNRPDKDQGTGK